MKHLSILLFALLISSCCGAKDVTQTESSSATTQQPKGGEFTPPKEDDSKIEGKTEPVTVKITPQTDSDVEVEEQTTPIQTDTFKTDDIHGSFNILLRKHVSSQGNVNYQGFKKDQSQLRGYIASLGEFMPESFWSKDEKLAYWINAYNAMTIDLIIRNYPLKSIKDIDKPWEQRLWKLDGKWYNLDEIEHQILRKMNEPRIHFGIVCASFSCPKLQNEAFTAKNLEAQLSGATREFLADEKRNNISENSLKLSKIFKWFAKDFKQDGSLIDFLNNYSEVSISGNAKKSFKEYNWALND